MRLRLLIAVCLLVLLAQVPASANTYWTYDPSWEAPTGYYDSAQGLLGQDLWDALHNIIRHDYFGSPGALHRFVPYGDAPPALDRLDQAGPGPAPFEPWELNLIFDNVNVLVTDPVSKQREHVWPASRQQLSPPRNDLGRDYADLHALRWIEASTNQARSNLNFGGFRADGSAGPSGVYWYPGEAHKGQVARMLFYMAVRYDGTEPDTVDLQIVNGNPAAWLGLHGDLESLIQWHIDDPPDAFELRRNHLIFSPTYVNEFGQTVTNNFYQGNRNPFIDNPQWAVELFAGGSENNDSQIYVGSQPNPDGSSSVHLDFGRVMQFSSPASQAVTVTKTGDDSTTFSIAASGTTTDPTGTQAFAPGSQTLELTVNAPSTSTTGNKNAMVTIDNTAATSAGPGLGSDDANDTITVSMTSVKKRTVVYSGSTPVDLGTTIVGGAVTPVGDATLVSVGVNSNTTSVTVAMTSAPNSDGIAVVGGTGADLVGATNIDGVFRTLGGAFLTAGEKSGSVGLSLTTLENGGLGLPGEGAYPDTMIPYAGVALDHAQPSFSSGTDIGVLDLDLGSFAPGSGIQSLGLDIFNRMATLGYTAALDIDGVAGFGDTGHLYTDLIATPGIAAGDSAGFLVFFDTAAPGFFEAQYIIEVSDEDLPGGIVLPSLTLNLSGYVGIAGDANLDRSVDDLDLALLQANFGESGMNWSDGDFMADGRVGLRDAFLLFESYGYSVGTGSAASVPEPGTLFGMGLAALWILSHRRSRSAA
ncbi:MAG: endonuclease [Phycisphaeraceae bacterium]|nr:endonuclease [Phycisphaeraceae bacterium]